jgi:hypothetical protein
MKLIELAHISENTEIFGKCQVKSSLCLTKHHTIKTWGSGCIDSCLVTNNKNYLSSNHVDPV